MGAARPTVKRRSWRVCPEMNLTSEKPAGAAAEEGGAIGEVEDPARNGHLHAAETPPLPAPRASGGGDGRSTTQLSPSARHTGNKFFIC